MKIRRRREVARRNPLPHQTAVVEWAVARDAFALFLEMRLGKCFVFLEWFRRRRPGRALIVAPLSVCQTWVEEATESGIAAKIVRGTDEDIREAFESGVALVVTNYDLLTRRGFHRFDWDVVVLDESTRIRNPQSALTKHVLKHFRSVPCRVILSGLPNPETPLDFFSQLQFISDDGSVMGCRTYWQFRQAYFAPDFMGYDWQPKPGSRDKIRREVERVGFILSRKDAGLTTPKVYEKRFAPLPPKLRTAYVKAEREFVVGATETKWKPVVDSYCRRICGGDVDGVVDPFKYKLLKELLTGELRGEPVVVWFQHVAEIKAVSKWLKVDGFNCRSIYGATSRPKRDQRRRAFMSGRLDILLVQVATARYGLNLSRMSAAIYYSNSWEFEHRVQSEDRGIHPKKTDPLLIVDLIAADTIDETVVAVLRDKRINAKSFLKELRLSLKRKERNPSYVG
jgi:SNF2 family DNA or RNA helicase